MSNGKLNKTFEIINVVNITCGFIVTLYNTYQVLSTIKEEIKYNRKKKSNKLGF